MIYTHRLEITCLAIGVIASYCSRTSEAQSTSAPAILQMYEARWEMIEDRMADIHNVGYGRMWVPPIGRAGSGFSVGYDVYDRFDLGKPRDETRYGTESSFREFVKQANRSSVDIYVDFVHNHNGFGNLNDSNFVASGGYPGFALTLPGVDQFGDFNDPSIDWLNDPVKGALFGLYDIAHEKNHQFYRHPVTPGDPNNIPAGSFANQPNASNTRFYPDQDLGGISVFDPELNQNVTLYDFNTSNPSAGDPVLENATGLLMRNARWLVQEMGVKGFRIDAAKHADEFVLDFIDQAVFRAIQELQHDGTIKPTYMFSEVISGDKNFLQSYIRQDLPNSIAIDPSNTTVGGNRDVLDSPLFFALRSNLTGNGLGNNWHNIRGASQDAHDRPAGAPVWHTDGSQGVAYVSSHDDTGAFLQNVAYAYVLMRPGNAIVYLNAEMDGPTGTFPQPGKVDALGGNYGETITKLVELRNSHGRGDFVERWIDPNESNIYIYEREDSALVALNSRNDSFVETRNGVQTAFAPGTVLVELTGNAADPSVDPGNAIPDAIRVNGSGQVDVSIPSNGGHGRGYVIYGVAPPQGSLSVGGVSSTLSGATPSAGNNGTARLADIEVVTGDTFTLTLNTTPVTLPTPAGESSPYRDVHADGDTAMFKINDGMDLNSNPGIDDVTVGGVAYGFENFTDVRTPGYIWDNGSQSNIGTGTGLYEQVIDATQLTEGRNYVTVRAFRHRNSATGGDGGPAVYTDFRRTIYVDRLPPESAIASFEPFASDPGNPNNRDLILESVDKTADNMHVFLNLGAQVTDAELLQLISSNGSASSTDYYDRDQRIRGYFDIQTGNHAVTIVTFETTGNFNVQRFAGLEITTNLGAGVGDLDADGFIRSNDLIGAGSLQEILESNNTAFNPAADANADGLVDNRDLFAIGDVIESTVTDPRVFPVFETLLRSRADFDENGSSTVDDLVALHAAIGGSDATYDVNVDGVVDQADLQSFLSDLHRTVPGDFNLDGNVDLADYALWRNNLGSESGIADANFDGVTNSADYLIWKDDLGFQRQPFGAAGAGSSAQVPEPHSVVLALMVLLATMPKTTKKFASK